VEKTSAKGVDSLILKPDQQAHYEISSTTLEKRAVSTDRFLAWTSDIIYLDNTKMNEVVGILENWYDVKITLENPALGNCLLSGKYKGDRLLNILEGLKFMQGIEYSFVNEREVIITGKPCN
jgi:ferric-dicitrate binding protein FerR (iron transport regulator)